MSTGERIRSAREDLDILQQELADAVGINVSVLSRIEKGTRQVRDDELVKIANKLHVTTDYLLGRTDNMPADLAARLPNLVSLKGETFRVPVVGRVAAGKPIITNEEIIGYEYIDDKYSRDGHEYFGLKIVGKSMEPTIMDGDIVIVRRQPCVENGEIAIVLIDGEEATAKEVKESADGITLIGHNVAVYAPHFYSAREVEELPIRIIGRVIQSIRKF